MMTFHESTHGHQWALESLNFRFAATQSSDLCKTNSTLNLSGLGQSANTIHLRSTSCTMNCKESRKHEFKFFHHPPPHAPRPASQTHHIQPQLSWTHRGLRGYPRIPWGASYTPWIGPWVPWVPTECMGGSHGYPWNPWVHFMDNHGTRWQHPSALLVIFGLNHVMNSHAATHGH